MNTRTPLLALKRAALALTVIVLASVGFTEASLATTSNIHGAGAHAESAFHQALFPHNPVVHTLGHDIRDGRERHINFIHPQPVQHI